MGSWLADLVPRRPVVVLVATLLLTVVFGGFASQSVVEDGVAVDNRLSEAQELLSESFGDPRAVSQVLFETTDGSEVRSSDALAVTREIRARIEDGPMADTLLERDDQPPLLGFLTPAETLVTERDLEVADLGDADVRDLQRDAEQDLPDEVTAQIAPLLADGDPPTAGLLLVFQDAEGLSEEELLEQQRDLAALVGQVPTPEGLQVSALSLELLLENDDIGAEVGRLFGTAFLIIAFVLGLMFWTRPPPGQRLRVLRRTAADVGLTLLTILFAIVWMQGTGVLLGPDYAGLIGYFDSQTQIVPILIAALGVDFAVHLTARYRTETGASRDPGRGYRRTFATVGVALLLDAVATAIGFLTNLFSPVDFLATLGVLAASGIMAAFVLTMTFLPAVRVLLDRRAQRRGLLPASTLEASGHSALPRAMERTVWLAERAPVATLAVAVALTGVGMYGFTQLDSRFELTDFVPRDDPQLATFQTLEEEFGGGFGQTTEVLLTGDLAAPASHDALVASLDRVADVDGVETIDGEADGTTLVSVLRQVPRQGDELRSELGADGLREDLTVEDDADVDGIYQRLLDEVPSAGEVLADTGDGWIGRAELRTSVSQGEALRLRDDLRDAFGPLRETGVSVVATSDELVQASVSEEIENAQLVSILVALGAVMLLLALVFGVRRRQPVVGVLTVLPVGFVLALTFGMMAVTGIPLNPVTATLAALSIGIGVPFTIHVTTRFLEEREVDGDGVAALRRSIGQTGGAVVASALTTTVGFGVLTTSTLLPFEQLGYVIVYAIVLAGVAATLILPSMLLLWHERQSD